MDNKYEISVKLRGVSKIAPPVMLLAVLLLSAAVGAGKRPWQRRVARDMEPRHKLSYQKVTPDMWPEEPDLPDTIPIEKFERALSTLCGRMPPKRLKRYAAAILASAKRFDGDPFLLAALMYHRSGCRPKTPSFETRFGLTRVDIDMHAPHVRGGEYRYFLKEGDRWHPHALSLNGLRFNKWQMEKAEPVFDFTAAVLSVFKKQCPDLDREFGGAPHRHPISHWFFGDKVKSAEPEDAVLTVRRRLLQYFDTPTTTPIGDYNGTPLLSPMDGVPRLMLDYFGNKRGAKGKPGHQGIDIAGLSGEPVRAVADGRVSFAGVDLKGNHPSRQTTPEEATAIAPGILGKGGLWMTLNHGNGFRTCYMHLTSIRVLTGDRVKAGDIIGTLGNSGTVASGPHLHLEFRVGTGERADPALHLRKMLVNPFENMNRAH